MGIAPVVMGPRMSIVLLLVMLRLMMTGNVVLIKMLL